jgi:hypothetical protein
MIHPNTELRFISPAIGYGVVATRLIPKGTITWVGDALDQMFAAVPNRVLPPILEEQLETYSFRDAQGRRILCWDHARYINHACNANCLSADFDFEVAIRDIHPGDELTDDYGTLNIEASFACLCGHSECRGIICGDDLLRYASKWDSAIHEVLPELAGVTQPLWPLVKEKKRIEKVLAGEQQLPSFVTHYCGSHPQTGLQEF